MKLFVVGIVCVMGLSAEALAKSGGAKGRPKHLNGEAKVTKNNTVDFEDTQIDAGPKTPMLSEVGVGKADKNYDFVKIRLRWHPEMVASAAQLD